MKLVKYQIVGNSVNCFDMKSSFRKL